MDADATTYITAVETADGSLLPTYIKNAINAFVIGCKSDGIWTAIKAACFLAGPTTIAGALVPLIGAAPTNNGFVSGDYDQTTGVKGDGSSHLDTGRPNDADPQNSNHHAVYVSELPGPLQVVIGAADPFNESGANSLGNTGTGQAFSRSRSSSGDIGGAMRVGFAGTSRSGSTEYLRRNDSATVTITQNSQTPSSRNVLVFDRAAGASPSTARIAFYSVGESLDLALLDLRLQTYMAALALGPTGNPTGNLNNTLRSMRHAL